MTIEKQDLRAGADAPGHPWHRFVALAAFVAGLTGWPRN